MGKGGECGCRKQQNKYKQTEPRGDDDDDVMEKMCVILLPTFFSPHPPLSALSPARVPIF